MALAFMHLYIWHVATVPQVPAGIKDSETPVHTLAIQFTVTLALIEKN